MCDNAKEMILRLLCLVCIAIGVVIAIHILHSDNLHCVERMCLSGMSLMGGIGVGMLLIWLFSGECGCMSMSLSSLFDNLASDIDVRQHSRHIDNAASQSYGGFRPSYHDSRNSYERARQQEERSIKELIRQLEEIAK